MSSKKAPLMEFEASFSNNEVHGISKKMMESGQAMQLKPKMIAVIAVIMLVLFNLIGSFIFFLAGIGGGMSYLILNVISALLIAGILYFGIKQLKKYAEDQQKAAQAKQPKHDYSAPQNSMKYKTKYKFLDERLISQVQGQRRELKWANVRHIIEEGDWVFLVDASQMMHPLKINKLTDLDRQKLVLMIKDRIQ